MRDMAGSRATISVALRYIICSEAQGGPDAETDISHEETQRPRLEIGSADHGPARSIGAALDLAAHMGASRALADIARLAYSLRRSLAYRAAGAIVGIAASGSGRTAARQRLSPHGGREGVIGELPAAASLCRAMEQRQSFRLIHGDPRCCGSPPRQNPAPGKSRRCHNE